MTGAELRAHRKAAGLSQQALAQRAGVCRETVQYWEAKALLDPRGYAPLRFLTALGLRGFSTTNARARTWGLTHELMQRQLEAGVETQIARWREREAQRAARRRVLCGAKTRKGTPCRNKSEPGRRRCKFHGGKSTGSKTAEGIARIAEAQRLRWTKWRAESRPLA